MTKIAVKMIQTAKFDISKLHNNSTTVKACGKITGNISKLDFFARARGFNVQGLILIKSAEYDNI